MLWLRRVEPLARPLIHAWFRVRRGLTLGVRGLVVDAAGRVLLVRHTYVPGWHLPGGGVERGESAEQAVIRELAEEAGVWAIGRPRLLSVHEHGAQHRGDHVLLYRVEAWEPCQASVQGEIAAVAWFAADALPADVTPGTRRRIGEALGDMAADPRW
jgi:ADP-ribose pyrophosphatase YjhB (NUDIX family)